MDFSALNSEQLLPVKHTDGAVLVTAGAGSGKTRLLTYRIANILEKGAKPYEILCITFTNKAASEMRERLAKLLDCSINEMWVMTFHAACARILRMYIDRLDGYDKNFTIYSDIEKERVLKRVINSMSLDEERFLQKAKFYISELKNNHFGSLDFEGAFGYVKDADKYKVIVKEYCLELRRCNALDFDDLLNVCYLLLSTKKEVLDELSGRFRYISVDEFQDTNRIQYGLIKLLAFKHGNVFAVGDEDQSIYSWRGANVGNMFDFQKDFNASVYKLEQNYRSTKKILNAANCIIKNNSSRIEKKLWTLNSEGDEVVKHCGRDEQDEAEFCVYKINHFVKNCGYKFGDIAILMRLNALTRPFEERLMFYNIPYSVYGGFKFFERKEIKDILAYLTVLTNHRDDEAFLRIINFPKRAIGNASIDQLRKYAKMHAKSLYDTVLEIETNDTLAPALIKKIKPLKDLLVQLNDYAKIHKVEEIIKETLERTGIKSLYTDGTEEGLSRLLNLNELIASASEFSVSDAIDISLEAYLQNVTLMSDIDKYDDKNDTVSLATVHSAKGLEFKIVFLVGMDESIFPISRADTDEQIEEERRLAYVGITRAQEKLIMTRANSRFLYGTRKYLMQSRFFAETDGGTDGRNNYASNFSSGSKSAFNNQNTYNQNASSSGSSFSERPKTTLFDKASKIDPRLLVSGTLVRHKTFGEGKILRVTGEADLAVAEVNFLSVGRKNLALMYAPLEVIG